MKTILGLLTGKQSFYLQEVALCYQLVFGRDLATESWIKHLGRVKRLNVLLALYDFRIQVGEVRLCRQALA